MTRIFACTLALEKISTLGAIPIPYFHRCCCSSPNYIIPRPLCCEQHGFRTCPLACPQTKTSKKKKRRASSVQFLHFSLVSRAKHNTRGRRVAWLSDTITHFEITDIYIHIKLLGGVFLSFLWPPVSRRHARSIPVTLRGENSPMPLVISSNRCTAWGTAPHA